MNLKQFTFPICLGACGLILLAYATYEAVERVRGELEYRRFALQHLHGLYEETVKALMSQQTTEATREPIQ